MAQQQGCHRGDLLISIPLTPLFKGAHQGLRAFHRRMAFPARQLRPGI